MRFQVLTVTYEDGCRLGHGKKSQKRAIFDHDLIYGLFQTTVCEKHEQPVRRQTDRHDILYLSQERQKLLNIQFRTWGCCKFIYFYLNSRTNLFVSYIILFAVLIIVITKNMIWPFWSYPPFDESLQLCQLCIWS